MERTKGTAAQIRPAALGFGNGRRRGRLRTFFARLSPQALVLMGTAVLITAGFVGLLVFGLTPGEPTIWDNAHNALFQSITFRTAGFNTVDIGKLPSASIFLITLLMFIGANPASCAGGVKITTVAIFLAQLRSIIRNQDRWHRVRVHQRGVPWPSFPSSPSASRWWNHSA